MQVKLKEARFGKAAGAVVAVADYEGRRLIQQRQAEPAEADPLDHDGDGRKGGSKPGPRPRRRRKKSPQE